MGIAEIIAAAGGGGAVTALGGVFVAYFRSRSATRRAEAEEHGVTTTAAATVRVAEIEVEERISARLLERIARLEDRIDEEHDACAEEIAGLRREYESKRVAIEQLRRDHEEARRIDRARCDQELRDQRALLARVVDRAIEQRRAAFGDDDTGVYEMIEVREELRHGSDPPTRPEIPPPARRAREEHDDA